MGLRSVPVRLRPSAILNSDSGEAPKHLPLTTQSHPALCQSFQGCGAVDSARFFVPCHAARREAPPAEARHRSPFHHTSEHDRGEPQRSVATTVSLAEATNDSLVLAKAATWGARRLWRDGYRYSKSGVMTFDLVKLAASQRALFDGFDRERSAALMGAMDACNRRFGRGTVMPAAANVERRRSWSTKCQMWTPRYTTQVSELPLVRG